MRRLFRVQIVRASIAGLLALSIALSALFGMPKLGHAGSGPEYVPGQVVVRLQEGASLHSIPLLFGATILDRLYGSSEVFLLAVPAGVDPVWLAEQLVLDPLVVYAEPNFLTDMPEDGSTDRIYGWAGEDPVVFEEQDATKKMNLADAHSYSTGAGTIVAVLDTGIQLDHPALAGHYHPLGFDFVDGDPFPAEEANGVDDDGDGRIDEGYGHGTHVAGIIHLGAPEAELLILRVLNSDGRGNIFWTASAMMYALANGADVINLSLGTASPSALLRDMVQTAARQDIVVVAAAGNLGLEAEQYPAAEDCAIGVTSVTFSGKKSDFSNYGAWVGLSAPGEDIYSAFPVDGYASWSGTSMATPLAAAQASLLLSAAPGSGLEQVGRWMGATSQPVDNRNPAYRGKVGQGQIDLLASLQVQAAGVDLAGERSAFATCQP